MKPQRVTHPLLRQVALALLQTFRSVRCFSVPGTTVARPRLVSPRRDARYSRGRHCVVRVHHRPARLDRGLSAGPYPPRKGCRKAAPSAARGYQVPVPALALLRRTALAIAWLWAYSKPVLHKMAYGTDVDHSHEQTGGEKSATSELEQLRARVAELEAEMKGGKA